MPAIDYNDATTRAAFEFFYGFARLEFALKENGYLKSVKPGIAAEPGWDKFIRRHSDTYTMSETSRRLADRAPRVQTVGNGEQLTWRELEFIETESELAIIVRVLKTVRNNLFHGGKSGEKGWAEPQRTAELLSDARVVLDELANQGNFEADYQGKY